MSLARPVGFVRAALRTPSWKARGNVKACVCCAALTSPTTRWTLYRCPRSTIGRHRSIRDLATLLLPGTKVSLRHLRDHHVHWLAPWLLTLGLISARRTRSIRRETAVPPIKRERFGFHDRLSWMRSMGVGYAWKGKVARLAGVGRCIRFLWMDARCIPSGGSLDGLEPARPLPPHACIQRDPGPFQCALSTNSISIHYHVCFRHVPKPPISPPWS